MVEKHLQEGSSLQSVFLVKPSPFQTLSEDLQDVYQPMTELSAIAEVQAREDIPFMATMKAFNPFYNGSHMHALILFMMGDYRHLN